MTNTPQETKTKSMKIYLGNNGKLKTFELMKRNGWGNVHLANHWQYPKEGIDWILDNGAYHYWISKKQFDTNKFLDALDKIEYSVSRPDFIIVPDIVAGGYHSLNFSLDWLHEIPGTYNCYLAVQDGMEPTIISKHIGCFDGLFVGGTIEWKLNTAASWVQLAHLNNLKCHIGKVGTFKRLVWAKNIGADSIDSSTFVQAKPGTGFKRIKSALSQTSLY